MCQVVQAAAGRLWPGAWHPMLSNLNQLHFSRCTCIVAHGTYVARISSALYVQSFCSKLVRTSRRRLPTSIVRVGLIVPCHLVSKNDEGKMLLLPGAGENAHPGGTVRGLRPMVKTRWMDRQVDGNGTLPAADSAPDAQTRQNRAPPAKTWRQKGAAPPPAGARAAPPRWVKRPLIPRVPFPMMAPPAAAVTDTWATHLVRITMGGALPCL